MMSGVCNAAQSVMVAMVVLIDGGALDLVSDRVDVSGVIDTITVTPDHVCSLSVGQIFSWRSVGNYIDWYKDDICCKGRNERSLLEIRERIETIVGVCSILGIALKKVVEDLPRQIDSGE